MSVAQKLYEGGHITYHRTDSLNLSKDIIPSINDYISENFSEKYIKNVTYKTKGKNAQEAHEAIRPTKIELNKKMSAEEKKLYTVIFNRTIASQMAPMEVEITTVKIKISNSKDYFITKSEKILFKGFSAIYKPLDEEEDNDNIDSSSTELNKLKKNDLILYEEIFSKENFTKPVGRFTEPSLIKKMEDLGIGRPSTYANIISKIQEREYVIKDSREGKEIETSILCLRDSKISEQVKKKKTENEKNKLFPTDIGTVVDKFLVNNFGHILNYELTAKVEKELDMIENSKIKWNKVVANFYNELKPTLIKLQKEKKGNNDGKRLLGLDNEKNKIYTLVAKYGPAILIENESKKDSKYVSLNKDQSIDTITLNDALKLLAYPKILGKYKDNEIILNNGQYGPYLKYLDSNISINSDIDLDIFNIDDAVKLIKENKSECNKKIGEYKKKDIMLLHGRYGPYLKYDNKNFSVPNNVDSCKLDLKKSLEIINSNGENIIKKFTDDARILKGKYGNYFKHNNKNIPIPKNTNIDDLTLDNCLEFEKNYIKKPFNVKK